MPYAVTCKLCSFERELDTLEDVLEFRDDHQRRYGPGHHIEFELLDDTDQPQ
ncbi:MAG: hypothetical protein ABEH83_00925 [Halobacterium sp.]